MRNRGQHVALWLLGYPDAALADVERALTNARAIERAATSLFTQAWAAFTQIHSGKYPEASAQLDELTPLAEKKGPFWTLPAMIYRGFLLVLTGKASDAVQMLASSLSASRQSRTTFMLPLRLSYLAKAHADIGHFEEASRFVTEALSAIETTKERWFEAEVDRIAGEIALKSAEPDAAKAEAYFDPALAVARSAGKVLGASRRNEHGAALARSGQAGRGQRSSRSGLRLVHQRVRHARSERSEGATQ